MSPPVVVVGAGLAGLACARALRTAGHAVQVVETADGVGGRVRTDAHDGFLLDRGFQVLFSAYPEVQRQIDLAALAPAAFVPGAQIRFGGFAALRSPLPARTLVLNADEGGPVSSACALTDVCPSYAPDGQALVSVSVLGLPADDDVTLEAAVRAQLRGWYGPEVDAWRLLRTYRIARAQPDLLARGAASMEQAVRLASGLFVAGDHRDNASINGALSSGQRAARAVIAARA